LNEYPSVAIVILNWNGQAYLQQFLPSVCATQYPHFTIVVADNASTDNSVSFLKAHYPAISIIKLEKNNGFAGGYNLALQQVKSDYFVLLNSDVEVTPEWLLPMVELAESNKSIAACQPKLLSYHQKNKFEYAGGSGGWIDKFGYPFSKGRVFDHCEDDNGQYNKAEPIFWASGAALFIRSSVFNQLSGFDDYFFAHQEEIDLCWRIQLAGYTIFSCPQAVVYHVGGGTLPKANTQKTYLNFRNNKIMLSKNLPWQKKMWILPLRHFLDIISACKELCSGNVGSCKAIIKAQWGYWHWRFWHRKKTATPIDGDKPLKGLLNSSIVWHYFIKKKKTFAEIVK
jgi:GT2 family glycosyltransferase